MTDNAERRPDHRLQLVLPAASKDRLDGLMKDTESSSYAEVVRNALRLYEAAVRESRDGGGLFALRAGHYVPVLAVPV